MDTNSGRDANRFFGVPFDYKFPRRLYARSVDFDPDYLEILDAVDADAFDHALIDFNGLLPEHYGPFSLEAPLYTVEINSDGRLDTEAAAWLEDRATRGLWLELLLEADPKGFAQLFESVESEGRPARLQAQPMAHRMQTAMRRSTSLNRFHATRQQILNILPATPAEGLVVLDVGQGSAAALIAGDGTVLAYVDMGAGVTRDTDTWPTSMTGFCLQNDPPVILSHWHYDHFQGANKFPKARGLTWIAPDQQLGPGPQTAMAQSLSQQGTLLVWNGQNSLRRQTLSLERCTGPAKDQNRSGIAVWVDGPDAQDPILLPGDAGYRDVPSLTATRSQRVRSLVVSHHGGRATGTPPADPGHADTRAVISCGSGNQYRHPLQRSLQGLTNQGWSIGHPNTELDDRLTMKRNNNLGHTGLTWGGTFPKISCSCGCSIKPTKT